MTHLGGKHVLLHQAPSEDPDNFHLLFGGESGDGRLQNTADGCVVDGNEAGIIEKGDCAHDELAIHAIRDTAVAGNAIAKVFDLEGALQSRGEEAAKRCDQGRKSGKNQDVEVKRPEDVCVADCG